MECKIIRKGINCEVYIVSTNITGKYIVIRVNLEIFNINLKIQNTVGLINNSLTRKLLINLKYDAQGYKIGYFWIKDFKNQMMVSLNYKL